MSWNKCDVCGRFIAIKDFGNGAIRKLLTPDSHFSNETYETLCVICADRHGPEPDDDYAERVEWKSRL